MTTSTVAALDPDRGWEPPGPGSWQLLADHYPRPVTEAMLPFTEVWSRETTAFMTEMGMPIKYARMAPVNGIPYISIAASGGSSKKTPPAWVLKVAARVVPSLRRAEKQLARQLAERPWVEGIARWYDTERPLAVERMTALTRVEAAALDDVALADHVRECERVLFQCLAEHMALHAHDSVPPGLFAASALDWGLELHTATDLLAGSSPASTGSSPELVALRSAVAGRTASTLDELRGLGPEVAAALDRYLEMHGWRLIDGYDIDCTTLCEVPAVVVALATSRPEHGLADRLPALTAAARERVPAAHREEFDRGLSEARAAYGVRDDNSGILVAWPSGLMRRAMLAAGQRLVERGMLHDANLAIEAVPSELCEALVGVATLDADRLAVVADYRQATRSSEAPRTLGPEEAPPPVGLPGALGLVFRALTIFGLGTVPDTAPLHGLGIGSQTYRGRVRLVLGAGEGFDAFEPGDVLVAPMTSPSYNVLLSLAGAVVTEEGGSMSHAAIMARELGIPAVIGAPGATTLLSDGEWVTVDPVAGRVVASP